MASSNELSKLLAERPGDAEGAGTITIDQAKAGAPASPYCLKLDAWGKRKGEELLTSELFRHLVPGPTVSSAQFADFFGAAFEYQPCLEDHCQDEARRDFLATMMDTAEYQSLHHDTALNETASEIAAASFAQQYLAMCQESEGPPDDMAQIRAAGRALDQAQQEVEEYQDACRGCGLGQGSHGPIDQQEAINVYKRVKQDPQLRRIFALAGRFRRFAMAAQRQKAIHGVDDLIGIIQDGEIARLTASELGRLGVEELELDTLRRIVERQAQCREFQGTERLGKGSIIVTVDESGSMAGEPIARAKGLALALAWLAIHQRRWCLLIGFSGGTEGNPLLLKPGEPDTDGLLDWLTHFYNGGTTMDVPIGEMSEIYDIYYAPHGKTDLICITDALVDIPAEMANSFLEWKKRAQAKMVSLVIGTGPGDLANVSDIVHCIESIDLDETGIQETLSI